MAQRHAKQLLKENLDKHMAVVSVEDMTIEEIEKLCGCRKNQLASWANNNPDFIYWLLDKGDVKRKMRVLGELALDRLEEVLGSEMGDGKFGTVAPKDIIKAAEAVTALADMYPASRREVTYLDAEVRDMPEEQLAIELAKVNKKLGLGNGQKEKEEND